MTGHGELAPKPGEPNQGIELRRLWWAVAAVAICAFLLANDAARLPNFNPDESRWISRAHYLADLADPFGPTWDDQYMTRGQPPLGSYAMGLALVLQGRDLETNRPWDFAIPWEENIAAGMKPVPEDLAAGRRASALLVAATSLAVIVLANVFVSAPWAIMAGAIYAVHPFTTYIGSIAMADALFGLLIALAAVAAAGYGRHPSLPRAALVGVLLGLGGATKLSPLAVAVGLCVLLLGVAAYRYLAERDSASALRTAASGAVILVAAAVAFVAAYPYLWQNPIENTRRLIEFRTVEMAAQASDWPVMAVPSRWEAVQRSGVNFFERFNVADRGFTVAGLGSASGPVRAIEVGVAVIGLGALAVAAMRAGPFSPRMAVAAVLMGQAAVTILGMRSEFDRYHLPIALLGVVALAAGLEWLARGGRRLYQFVSAGSRLEAVGVSHVDRYQK
jgi:hypothetical protein